MKPSLKIIHNDVYPTPGAGDQTSARLAGAKVANLKLVSSNPAATVQVADLNIEVQSIKVARGQIMLAIYDSEMGFNKSMFVGTKMSAKKGSVSFSFPDLPLGTYAILAYHDVNGNGKLDTNLLGMPTEPWGGSLQHKTLHSAPTWNDAKFKLGEDGLSMSIKLQ